jgi:acetyl esterase/lipase
MIILRSPCKGEAVWPERPESNNNSIPVLAHAHRASPSYNGCRNSEVQVFNLKGNMMQEIDFSWDEALERVSTEENGMRHWHDVVFAHPHGFRPLTLHISVPKTSEPPPLIVFIHGGAWLSGHPTVSNPVYRTLDFEQKFIDAGFAFAKISYRFSSEGPFPMCLHDCKSAVRYLRNRAALFGIDASRFAAFGDSAGSHLASLLGLTNGIAQWEGDVGDTQGSSAVKAVVSWFGPTNLLTMQEQAGGDEWQDHNDPSSPESLLIGGAVQDYPDRARAASPITYASKNCSPILIQHGTKDRLVPFAQAQELHDALQAAGADSTLIPVEGADHCFWGVPGDGIVEDAITFLRAKL